MGFLVQGLLAGGAARFVAIEATEIAAVTRDTHGLGPGPARLAAEGVVAALMMAIHIDGDERVTLQLQSEAPLASFIADVWANGGARARLTPSDFAFDLQGHIRGVFLAIKSAGPREVYRGVTAIRDESIEDALLRHFDESQQTQVALRVVIRQDLLGAVVFAGGILVERLPPSPGLPALDPEEFTTRYESLHDGAAEDLVRGLAAGELPGETVVVGERRDLRWSCTCSEDKVESVLIGLGPETLGEMIDEDKPAEVECHFCRRLVSIPVVRLRELRELATFLDEN